MLKKSVLFLIILIILSSSQLAADYREKKIVISNIHNYTEIYETLYVPNFNVVNKLLEELSLDKLNLTSSVAIETKFSLGGNYYFGILATIPQNYRRNYQFQNETGNTINRYMEFSSYHYGISVDRRFVLPGYFQLFTGLQINETIQRMTISQTDGNNSWNPLTNPNNNNFSQNYILKAFTILPQVNLLYHVFDSCYLKAGVGYVIDFMDNSEWEALYSNKTYDFDSPNKASLNGLMFNVGISFSLF